MVLYVLVKIFFFGELSINIIVVVFLFLIVNGLNWNVERKILGLYMSFKV